MGTVKEANWRAWDCRDRDSSAEQASNIEAVHVITLLLVFSTVSIQVSYLFTLCMWYR